MKWSHVVDDSILPPLALATFKSPVTHVEARGASLYLYCDDGTTWVRDQNGTVRLLLSVVWKARE